MKNGAKAALKGQFIELRAVGLSYEDAARQLGVSKPTLIAWSRELKHEIANAKAMRLDELFQKFAVAKEKRIEVFGRRLDAILAELDKRDLTQVRTERLLELALKYGKLLREEHEELKLQGEKPAGIEDFFGVASWPI